MEERRVDRRRGEARRVEGRKSICYAVVVWEKVL